MKNIKYIIFFCLVLLLGCKQDYIGQFPVDGTKPQSVSNVQIQNIAGKVMITYQLPNETDLLYVKAVYTNTKGEKKEVKTSVFSNTMEIPGFGRSAKDTIQLISVDRSQNESNPVKVVIEPLDSPIYDILNSVNIFETFGGIKFKWDNPTKEQIVVSVFREFNGERIPLDAFYTMEANANQAIRGLDTVLYSIGVTIRDVYGNRTDTILTTKKPLYEIKLPAKASFKQLPLAPQFLVSPIDNGWDRLWDGSIAVASRYYLAPAAPQPYFTIDLGKSYILSRIKVWPRILYAYSLHNPRFFEIWGTNDINNTTDPNNWIGWTKLGSFESYKPSGSPDGIVTTEDVARANAGEEFEFVDMIAPVHYIRFKSVENWSKSNSLHIAEIELYGNSK